MMTSRWFPFVLACSVFAGCGDDAPPLGQGALALSWQISPRGCESAEVDRVAVTLEGPTKRVESFGCSEGLARVEDLTPGSYTVALEGLDQDGHAVFISDVATVSVRPDVISEAPHQRLTAKPASIGIEWRFENGRVCGANGVSEIQVFVFDKADYELGGATFDCDSGEGMLDGFVAGTYVVEATAISDDEIFVGLGTVSVGRGDQVTTEVVLEPR